MEKTLRKLSAVVLACSASFLLTAGNSPAQMPGSLDPSFGGDGIVITPVGPSNEQIYDTAITADNKIVAAGQTLVGSQNDILVLRYNDDGSLDTTFGGDGIVTTAIGTSNDFCEGVAVQPDNKIVVAGYYYEGTNLKAVLLRYNSDGSLDTSFDGDGKVVVDFTPQEDMFRDVQIQGDGKIVVCGKTWNGNNYDVLLARFNSNGSFDTTFNSTGYNIIPVGTEHDYVFQLKLQPDGKIVTAGYLTGTLNNEILIIRVNSNGTLDNTFGGGDGISLSSWPNDLAGSVFALQLQPDGKIVVAGSHDVFPGVFDARMVVARYTSDGSLDPSFGSAGVLDIFIATTHTGVSESISDIALQPDGKIVASGSSFYGSTPSPFILLRITSDGMLDNTFGNGSGYVFTDIGNDNQEDLATSIEFDNNGKILLGGYTTSSGNTNVALARYFSGLEGADPCSTAPTGLFADNITNTRARVHWDAQTGVTRYHLQYRVSGTNRWTNAITTPNVKSLSRLTPGTTYEYRVRSECTALPPSPWSNIETFTTL